MCGVGVGWGCRKRPQMYTFRHLPSTPHSLPHTRTRPRPPSPSTDTCMRVHMHAVCVHMHVVCREDGCSCSSRFGWVEGTGSPLHALAHPVCFSPLPPPCTRSGVPLICRRRRKSRRGRRRSGVRWGSSPPRRTHTHPSPPSDPHHGHGREALNALPPCCALA